ncbi:MAG: NADH:flavin oxidoreductase [Chloroflexi bacterium]|nr:NADH:flavin oxidoreductase [Chloroflexota bacterium]
MSINVLDPYKIGKMELKNRIVRSATWDGSADQSGVVTDASVAIYREVGRGGVGLIITGYAFVSASGRAKHGQYGIHTDAMIAGMRRLVEVAHEGGARIALQVAHAGAGADYQVCKDGVSPAVSEIAGLNRRHREMTGEEIESVIDDFRAAAVRAREAGFDAVEFHGAHGYLFGQFLSPIFNRRADRWGGSLGNRSRFHLAVVGKARQAVGEDFPMMMKFGVQDEKPHGLTLEEGLETARQLVAAGLDAIEVSAGVGNAMQVMREGEAERPYLRERAAAVKRAVSAPVICVGGIRSLGMAQSIVDSGDADLIAMCRPFIREPGLVARWLREETSPARCISCQKCFGAAQRGKTLACQQEVDANRRVG